MFKKVVKFGGQTGNEDQFEKVVITEEKITGDDGVERIITKKTTTKPIVQKQQVTQGAKVPTAKRTVFTSDGKELPEVFKNFSIKSETKKQIEDKNTSQPTDDDKEFAEECLKRHNYYREKHGVKPLKLSSKVSLF
jgi:uncharacterized protein YkwD